MGFNMELFRKTVIAIFFALVVLAAAFVAVVVVTRPTPVQVPVTNGWGHGKVLSVQPIDAKRYESLLNEPFGVFFEESADVVGLVRSYRVSRGDFFSLRIQPQGESQGTVPSVFELEIYGRPLSDVGTDVEYELRGTDYNLQVFHFQEWPTGLAEYGCIVQPDPLPWFHKRENSLSLAVFAGLALLSLVALVIGILGWLAPIYIAKKRGHPNFMPIAVITILLGWTFIGWAVCLAWSLSNVKKSQDAVPEPVAR